MYRTSRTGSIGRCIFRSLMMILVTNAKLILGSANVIPTFVKLSQRPFRSYVKNRAFLSTTTNSDLSWNDKDEYYLMKAVKLAERGYGHTFPNPAVGCVLVNQNTGAEIGSGYHPRAGFPHAEIFALLEATNHLDSGVAAADAVVQSEGKPDPQISALAEKYTSECGPKELFSDCFADIPVTAYVTLEPCCHYGRTPPCAASFVLAKVRRVVVGFRDPNPRVDGGGVQLMADSGIHVVLPTDTGSTSACRNLVTNFSKRILPRTDQGESYDFVSGKMRRALRALSNRMQQDNSIPVVEWGGDSIEVDDNLETAILDLILKPEWMEHVDSVLWKHELVVLKLGKGVAKKKGAKLLGQRIAEGLSAHLAQTKGHTVLLYRPGMPPVLTFDDNGVLTV